MPKPDLHPTRYYAILDTGYVSPRLWLDKFDALAAGGAHLIQIRAKKETRQQRRALAESAYQRWLQLPADSRPHFIVNDDLPLALSLPQAGLHIGQEDTPPDEARRRLGPDRIIGLSTHSTTQAQAAMDLPEGTLDYFVVGPLFATPTKPDYTPVGLELARWAVQQKPALPFFCIGGIKRQNLRQVLRTGASRVVTVSDTLLDPDTAQAVRQTLEILGR